MDSDPLPLRHSPVRAWPIIAREGWAIIGVIALIGALLSLASWLASPVAGAGVGFVCAVIVAWAIWFFRDPERAPPDDPGAIICGADGVVCFIGAGTPPAELGVTPDDARGMTRVSVFMNIFNVHVNRAPVSGVVEKIAYRPGKFFNASFDKASEHNERQSILLRTGGGRAVAVVQIAGLVARRIVCRVGEGQALGRGERFGLIRFGSRVDHYLPAGVRPLVELKQRTLAGVTVLARLPVSSSSDTFE